MPLKPPRLTDAEHRRASLVFLGILMSDLGVKEIERIADETLKKQEKKEKR